MNFFKKLFLFCPVPEDQKPIQEFISLKENFLFHWTTLKRKSYNSFLFFSFFYLFLFFFLLDTNFLKNITINSIFFCLFFTSLFFNIFFLLIIFRYIEINKRFSMSKVIYEEGSWYDSQIWEKPFSIIKNDKLISRQKIEPFLQRLYKTNFSFIFFSFFFFFLIIK